MSTIGHFPDGKIAFKSEDLRGLITYGRKHGITRADLGDCISGDGIYTVTFGNGVVSKGTFADQSVMLGFFLGRTFVTEIDCDRTTFNNGAAMGRITLPRHCDIGRNGTMRFGPWLATAYRDANQTPLVRFTRCKAGTTSIFKTKRDRDAYIAAVNAEHAGAPVSG